MHADTQTIPARYKQTELGVIPVDWRVVKLGDCLFSPPRYGIGAAAVEYSDRLPKYIRITDISEDGRFLPEKPTSVNNTSSANYFLSKGDLVVARTGASVGKSYLYQTKDGPLVFAGFLICLIPDKSTLLPEYLSAYLHTTSYWNWVRLTSMRSGQPGINGNEYAKLLIPLPEIHEQILINETLSDTVTLIEKLETLIEKKKSIKQSAMYDLLTGKHRLPEFSDGWKVKKLGEMGAFSKGSGVRKHESYTGDIPCVRYGELYTHHNDHIKKYYSYISVEVASTAKRIKTGDVLFAGSGETKEEIGKCAAFTDNFEAYAGGDIIIFSPHYADSRFLGYLLNMPEVIRQKASRAQGDAVVHIGASSLQYIRIKLPEDKKEQVAIANTIADMDAEIEELDSQLAKYRNIKQGMMQVLLTGKIRLI